MFGRERAISATSTNATSTFSCRRRLQSARHFSGNWPGRCFRTLWNWWLGVVNRRPLLISNVKWVVPVWCVALILIGRAVSSNPHREGLSRSSPFSAAGSVTLEDFRSVLRDRHFFFCASPGRSGSMYLSEVLRTGVDVISLHEPEPKMNDAILRNIIIHGMRSETFQDRAHSKMGGIFRSLAGTSPNVSYAETSHMFIKTYADVIVREVAPYASSVTIVALHRNIEDVLWSQFRLGWHTKHHSGRDMWYYDARQVHDSERVVRLDDEKRRHEMKGYEQASRLLEYNADVAGRTKALEEHVRREQAAGRLHNVRFVHLKLGKGRQSEEELSSWLKHLRVAGDPERRALIQKRVVNSRDEKKDRSPSTSSSRRDISEFFRSSLSREHYRGLLT